MTLAEFLLARIAEDEQAARMLNAREQSEGMRHTWHGQPVVPRVLAECEAKRRILALHLPTRPNEPPLENYGKWCRNCTYCDENGNARLHEMPCPTLRLLALPYADHPEYREEWKP